MSAPRVLTPIDADYPALLAATPLPPTLWVCGALLDADGLAIGIVGSRRATTYGVDVAERLAADLAARGVTIASGLARASATAAQLGAPAAVARTTVDDA